MTEEEHGRLMHTARKYRLNRRHKAVMGLLATHDRDDPQEVITLLATEEHKTLSEWKQELKKINLELLIL